MDSRPSNTRRPSLLPAFEPFSSSPGGLPRVSKRKFDDTVDAAVPARDDRRYYPTPIPTSSTGMLPSSPRARCTRPALQRSVSTLSERAPLGAVPSVDVPANGESVLMGRSSNSSDYQLSANRLISRVHVSATYHAPSERRTEGEIVVECLGWNGCKVHYLGQVVELAKGETFVSDRPMSPIMVDVQDTRVLLLWPRRDESTSTLASPGPSSPTKKVDPAADQFASSPPSLCPRLESPVSPSPAALQASTFASTFVAGQSFSFDEEAPVHVYEDHDSADELPKSPTPTPAVKESPAHVSTPQPSSPAERQPADSQSSLSEPEELSENDEENDPIVHSFGPFGDNLLSKFEAIESGSPNPRKKATLKLSFSSPSSTIRTIKRSLIKNHVINQLAFSRVHSVPISQIFATLPSEMKTVSCAKVSSSSDLAASTTSPSRLTHGELQQILEQTPCIGEISREGKDAAGKALENEYYYVPEMDDDEARRDAVSIGKPPMRNARKQHKVRTYLCSLFDLPEHALC